MAIFEMVSMVYMICILYAIRIAPGDGEDRRTARRRRIAPGSGGGHWLLAMSLSRCGRKFPLHNFPLHNFPHLGHPRPPYPPPPRLMMPFPSLFLVTSPPRLMTSLPPLPADFPPRCGSSPLAPPLFFFRRPELEPAYSYYYEELGG